MVLWLIGIPIVIILVLIYLWWRRKPKWRTIVDKHISKDTFIILYGLARSTSKGEITVDEYLEYYDKIIKE